MSAQKQELYNVIENLPEELSIKVIDYIEYLKFVYTTSTAPSDLIVKNNQKLVEKLEEGMNDTNNGRVCSLEQAFEEVEQILTD